MTTFCTSVDHENIPATHEVFVDEGEPVDWFPYCKGCMEEFEAFDYKIRSLPRRKSKGTHIHINLDEVQAEMLIKAGYPEAPELIDDTHEVATWLRKMAEFVGTESEDGEEAVYDALILFKHANPETRGD